MPAKSRQQLRLIYRIVRGHGPLLHSLTQLCFYPYREHSYFSKQSEHTLALKGKGALTWIDTHARKEKGLASS